MHKNCLFINYSFLRRRKFRIMKNLKSLILLFCCFRCFVCKLSLLVAFYGIQGGTNVNNNTELRREGMLGENLTWDNNFERQRWVRFVFDLMKICSICKHTNINFICYQNDDVGVDFKWCIQTYMRYYIPYLSSFPLQSK